MSKELYFLPMISKALISQNPEASLKNVFDEIKRLCAQDKYAEGFGQFKIFMDEICRHNELLQKDGIRRLIVDFATEFLGGSDKEKQKFLEILKSYPKFLSEYEMLCQETAEQAKILPSFQLFLDGHLISEVSFTESSGTKSISNLTPGRYSLLLNTGRVIWEEQLTSKELIWEEAFPGKELELAAETDDTERKPTKEIILLDGKIILRSYAGIESGILEIELTR